MLTVTLRNLFARKIRLVLTAFAIVLGVAFVSGSLIFTGAMGGAFDDIIEGSTADVEVGYEGANDFDSAQDNRTLSGDQARSLAQLPEVEAAYPQLSVQSVYVIGEDGKVVGGNGPPGLGLNYTRSEALSGKPIVTLVEGSPPDGPHEIALDVDTVEKAGYDVGDEVPLVTGATPPQLRATLTGIVEFGSGGLNGATLTLFDTEFMQERFFGGGDVYTGVSLSAAEGVSQEELAAAAQKELPKGVVARTGDDVVETNKQTLDEVLGFLNTFLLVFAGIALVVGVFLIVNTFSILVAQRSRELALLRALGASRRQVNRSVLLEAFVVGLVGSTLGLGLGYVLALALRWLFGRFGLDLSRADFPVQASTVAWSYAVGVLVTLVAAYVPARRASRIPPVAAMRDDVALPEESLRRRVLVAAAMIVLGVLAIVLGFVGEGGTGLSLIGLGMLLVLIGVALVSPVLGRPVIRLFDVGYRKAFGAVGRLAAQNALRNPRRTAATASALMIGLALVATMSILGSSASASTDAAIKQALTSQFVVSNVVGTPFSTDVAAQIRKVEGVRSVAAVRAAFPEVDGETAFVAAVDPKDFGLALAVQPAIGSLAALRPGTVAVDERTATRAGVGVGDQVSMRFQGGVVRLRVIALYANRGTVPGNYLVTPDTLRKGGLAPMDSMLFVTKEPGADTDEVRRGIERVTDPLPTVTVKDPEGYAAEQKEQIGIFLNLIYGLLGLSLVIAVLGIVNTLALSVIERTREVGLLRAVGLSRRQLRTMIRLEAVVIGVLGALLGVLMGLAFGVGLIAALEDQGLTELSIPWAGLAAFVAGAAVLGMLAAVFPARRAARLDVLRAIATE